MANFKKDPLPPAPARSLVFHELCHGHAFRLYSSRPIEIAYLGESGAACMRPVDFEDDADGIRECSALLAGPCGDYLLRFKELPPCVEAILEGQSELRHARIDLQNLVGQSMGKLAASLPDAILATRATAQMLIDRRGTFSYIVDAIREPGMTVYYDPDSGRVQTASNLLGLDKETTDQILAALEAE